MESTDKGLNDHVIIDKTTLSTEKQSMIWNCEYLYAL
jgi:hypothetical protein